MHIPRIYQNSDLHPGNSCILTTQASHHIINVLRLKIGDSFIIFNGLEGEYTATLLSKNTVHIEKYHKPEVESPLQIHLGQALCRHDKMDYIVQKAVELGVYSITPLITRRSENKFSDKRLERWERIIISACEQSGRTYLPKIEAAKPLSQWITTQASDVKLILTPKKSTDINQKKISPSSVSILIGPESGFEQGEVDNSIHSGFKPLTLGPRILRTETAALTAISVLQLAFGDFRL